MVQRLSSTTIGVMTAKPCKNASNFGCLALVTVPEGPGRTEHVDDDHTLLMMMSDSTVVEIRPAKKAGTTKTTE